MFHNASAQPKSGGRFVGVRDAIHGLASVNDESLGRKYGARLVWASWSSRTWLLLIRR